MNNIKNGKDIKEGKIRKWIKKIFTKKVLILFSLLLGITIIVIIYFFQKNINKNWNMGNTLSNKSIQEIEEYILNISSYEAEIEVTITSNKNENQYKIKQSYSSPNIEKQVVQEPSNLQGLETIYDGKNLTIRNTNLNLTTIYQEYPYFHHNDLWLHSFIEEYRQAKDDRKKMLIEENNKVIMKIESQAENQSIRYKTLVINKEENKIEQLLVQDKNQKNLVYILYNEIKINSLKKDEILAFQLEVPTMQY